VFRAQKHPQMWGPQSLPGLQTSLYSYRRNPGGFRRVHPSFQNPYSVPLYCSKLQIWSKLILLSPKFLPSGASLHGLLICQNCFCGQCSAKNPDGRAYSAHTNLAHQQHIYFLKVTQKYSQSTNKSIKSEGCQRNKTRWLVASCVIIECLVEIIWKGKQRALKAS